MSSSVCVGPEGVIGAFCRKIKSFKGIILNYDQKRGHMQQKLETVPPLSSIYRKIKQQ